MTPDLITRLKQRAVWIDSALQPNNRAFVTRTEATLMRAAAAELERLQAALTQIAAGEGVYGAQAHEYKQIARSALGSAG